MHISALCSKTLQHVIDISQGTVILKYNAMFIKLAVLTASKQGEGASKLSLPVAPLGLSLAYMLTSCPLPELQYVDVC